MPSSILNIVFAAAVAAPAAPVVNSVETLDWGACVQEAAGRNPGLLAAHSSAEQAASVIDSAKGAYYPQVAATLDGSRTAVDDAGFNGDTRAYGDSFSYGLTVRQSLFNGFKDQATVERHEAEFDSGRATVDKTGAELAFSLRSAFYSHLYAQELIELSQRFAARRKENVRLVELRFQGGRENRGSLLKSQASLTQSLADVVSAQRFLRAAQAELARVLGRPAPGPTRVKAEFILPKVPPAPDPVATGHATPVVKAAEAQARAAHLGVKQAYAEAYPDVSATASAQRAGGTWAPDGNHLSVGLAVSVPLFSGGTQTADVRAAAADAARADAVVMQVTQQATTDVVSAYNALADAVQRVTVQEEILKAAALQEEIVRSQYNLGLETFTDWDLIETGLSDAERALLTSRRDAALAVATYERALGHTLSETSGT